MPDPRVAVPDRLPVLPLRNAVAFPATVLSLGVGRPRSLRLIDDLPPTRRLLAVVAQIDEQVEDAGWNDIQKVGTMVEIDQMLRVPDGSLQIVVRGLSRIRLIRPLASPEYLVAATEADPEGDDSGSELAKEALHRSALGSFQRLVAIAPYLPAELIGAALSTESSLELAYLIANNARLTTAQRQQVLELATPGEKLEFLMPLMAREIEIIELGRRLHEQAEAHIGKAQREFMLREQLRILQTELGEVDPEIAATFDLRARLEAFPLPAEARRDVERELSRLERLPSTSPESGVIRTYLEIMASLPWQRSSGSKIDIRRARAVLDRDHYDLQKVKQRILEHLAVRKLKQERGTAGSGREPILCLVGPPGVGKTSLGQSIARAMGRRFVRSSLGGVHDESEIRGHRRTYVGAMPGRIIQALRRVEVDDPVFMLDEVDKLGTDWRGDPASALLEVLDPEQNREFRDSYIDAPFDLSRVMFITTANNLEAIPPALEDRMEVINLPGYTEEEKVQIARRYLIPKQIAAQGLRRSEVRFDEKAVRLIIREYTREAGVRSLERDIASVLRRLATRIAEHSAPTRTRIDEDEVREALGKRRHFDDAAERIDRPGIAIGLVWTPVGGEIVFVEATATPGKGDLKLTGQLGEVMKESAMTALTYLKSRAAELGIPVRVFEEIDLHVHVPAGAQPKEGPSAGITVLTALASILTGTMVTDHLAMTGEISLRGRVLPVGGVKEKVLGAHRAGIRRVILPAHNEADLADIPAELRDQIEFLLVGSIDQALDCALPGLRPTP